MFNLGRGGDGKSQLKENTWVVGMEHFTNKNVNYKILEPEENLENHFTDYFLGNMSSVFQGQMSSKVLHEQVSSGRTSRCLEHANACDKSPSVGL